MNASSALNRVARGHLCAGCGGCALVAPERIAMAMAPPGYLRPVQNGPLTPGEEARIARICPGLGQSVAPGSRIDDVLWGPYVSMQTGHATDPGLRHAASSGGALSALLIHLLDSGTVDAVVQTTASRDVPVANVTVVSETPDQVMAAAGSRYAPSAPLADLAPLLADERRFAFVGKPCDVAALRALAAVDERIDARFPVMLSFFCAGVPSQAGAEAVLAKLGTDLQETAAFRYRGHGWPGRATARLKDGSERSMSYHDSWGGILSNHAQHRCKICADGTGAAADLVCADAWHCDDRGYPLFEERDGISLIVARTEAGAGILDAATRTGRLATQAFEPGALAAIQPGQLGRRRVLLARLAALKTLGRPAPRYRGLHILGAARHARPAVLLRNFLGMIRRGLKGRVG